MSDETQQGRCQASPSLACSQLRAPEDAPQDGTMILAAVGWPWLVPAVWDGDSQTWSVCAPGAEVLEDEVVGRYWENDAEPQANLLGWLPWPDLPGGYVLPSNVRVVAPPSEGEATMQEGGSK